MDQYPTIRLIVAKGDALAAITGLLPLLGALAAMALAVITDAGDHDRGTVVPAHGVERNQDRG